MSAGRGRRAETRGDPRPWIRCGGRVDGVKQRAYRRVAIIGILDDDCWHQGSFIRGIKVLGELDMLFDLLRRHVLDEVIIAMSETDGVPLREYVLACCRHKVPVRVVPVISKFLENPSASRGRLKIHDVTVDDLLHRPPVRLNAQETGEYLHGARVLVTGAGGSNRLRTLPADQPAASRASHSPRARGEFDLQHHQRIAAQFSGDSPGAGAGHLRSARCGTLTRRDGTISTTATLSCRRA